MRRTLRLLGLGLSLVLVVWIHPLHAHELEARAFEDALTAWFESTRADGPDPELVWARSVRLLAKSRHPTADEYLAKLGLLGTDGVISQEWGCAATQRGMRLAKLLQAQERMFQRRNFCHVEARRRGLDLRRACASRDTYARQVASLRELPLPDLDGACLEDHPQGR